MQIRILLLFLAIVFCLRCQAQTLGEANVDTFKKEFNGSEKNVRLVSFLSPT